jgi:hypothetical protein
MQWNSWVQIPESHPQSLGLHCSSILGRISLSFLLRNCLSQCGSTIIQQYCYLKSCICGLYFSVVVHVLACVRSWVQSHPHLCGAGDLWTHLGSLPEHVVEVAALLPGEVYYTKDPSSVHFRGPQGFPFPRPANVMVDTKANSVRF